jgi:energy-coupling factor transporter ATP-binding protein EcfA2
MLTTVRIRNYRCFYDHTVPLGTKTAIVVGKNNAGKSTLVEVLRLLSLVTERYHSLQFRDPPAWTGLPRYAKGVRPSLRGIDANELNVFSRYGDPPAVLDATFSNGASISLYIGPELALHAVIKNKNAEILRSLADARRTRIPQVALLPQIGPLQKEERVLSEDYVRSSLNTTLSSLHFRNQLRLFRDDYLTFRRAVEESWPGVRITSMDVEGDRGDQVIRLMIQDHEFVAEIGWMGHGLQMWLQTIWFLVRSESSDCVILDEPDVYMHADLQRRLIRMLRTRDRQTVVATHSTEMMGEVEASEILVLDRSEPESRFAASLPAAQRAIESLGSIHNLSLARLWSARRCLLLEGKDLGLLRVFQDTLFPHSEESFQSLPNYSIGGWGGWQYAIGSSLAFRNAAGDSITTYCIMDSDYYPEEEVARRYEQAAQRGVDVHIWARKEIENYLLVPAAIERVIRSGRAQFRLDLSDEVVSAKIDEAAQSRKDEVFDSLASEYLAANRAGGASAANKRARQRVDASWGSREGRAAVVSGKAVFAEIARWSQEQHGVSLSPRLVAREIRQDELAAEVVQVVTAVERAHRFAVFNRGSASAV